MDSLLEFPSKRALSVCIWYVLIEMLLTQYLYTLVSKLMSLWKDWSRNYNVKAGNAGSRNCHFE
jgi:hypothetical protein